MTNYLRTNSKLRKSGAVCFDLPAVKTCPGALECLRFCYACKGFYRMTAAQRVRRANFELTRDGRFPLFISDEINRRDIRKVRIHSSGDFYSRQYIDAWRKIATLCPYTLFYAYTKSVHLFQGLELPANMRIIYSRGGRFDHLIKDTDFQAKVFSTRSELRAAGYTYGSDHDDVAAVGKNKKIGLVRH